VQRIRDSVVAPAQARGKSRIWFAGISLGALAALSYAARHEADVAGIVLISPYPATRDILREVDAAGGLDRWHPVIPEGGDLEREAWAWLSTCRDAGAAVYCYYASGDRFEEITGKNIKRRFAIILDSKVERATTGRRGARSGTCSSPTAAVAAIARSSSGVVPRWRPLR
jgi:pimeloyl-ACP methyl ester carboxylesterase